LQFLNVGGAEHRFLTTVFHVFEGLQSATEVRVFEMLLQM